MSDVIVIAIVAGGATVLAALLTLAGVFAGALLEPVKLRAVGKARTRQERAERCARLAAAAQDARDRSSDLLRVIQAARAAGKNPDRTGLQELSAKIHETRKELRICVALVMLSGPDDLATAATKVKLAEEDLVWPGTSDRTDERLAAVLERYDDVIVEFFRVARERIG